MTAEYLQDELVDELRTLFAEELFEKSTGERVPLAVYPQDLPLLTANEDDEELYPYCIVRLVEGNVDGYGSAQTINVVLVFGVYSSDRKRTGYRQVLHLVHKVYSRFAAKQQLGRNYIFTYPVRWQLQDIDTHPYYLGGMQLTFDAPAVQTENPYV